MKNIRKAIQIQILCFQLMFGQAIFAGQERDGMISAIEPLKSRMESFRFSLVGGDKPSECEEEAIKDAMNVENTSFSDFLAEIPVVTREEAQAKAEKECTPERVSGHLDIIVEKILKAEEDNKGVVKVAEITIDELQALEFQRKASELKHDMMLFARDNNQPVALKREAILNYLNDVALPLRDYFIATESYLVDHVESVAKFYNIALPTVPSELLEGEDATTFKSQLEVGLNPSTSPFHLKVEMPILFGEPTVVYDQTKILSRDSISILKAPTTLNYVKALKWMTIQMLLTQKQTYNAMNKDFSDIEIPNSCQKPENGNLLASVKNAYSEEQADELLDNILINQKMIISEDDSDFFEFYLNSVDRNPMVEGYSGLMPFEDYRHARQGLDKVEHRFLEPDLDDRTHYQTIIDMRMGKALSHFRDNNSWFFGLWDGADSIYSGADIFQSFFAEPEMGESYSFEDEESNLVEIETSGLSVYIANLMRRHKVINWFDLIGKDLEGYLKSQTIKIKFPSLYSSSIRKQWALSELHKWFSESQSRTLSGTEEIVLKNVCRYGQSRNVAFCADLGPTKIVTNLLSYLDSLKNGDAFIPTRMMDNDEHLVSYQMISQIWERLVERSGETKAFSIAFTNEYDYLLDQFEFNNPWARARLSYLLALDELGAIKDGVVPEFSQLSNAEQSAALKEIGLLADPTNDLVNRMNRAAFATGINTTLHPAYANYFLKKAEKTQVWQESLKGRSELFNVTGDDGRELYQKLEKVSAQTFLNGTQIDSFMKNVFGENLLDEKAKSNISEILESEIGEKGELMIELYNQKGNIEKQIEIYTKFATENGIDEDFSPKVNFLVLDNFVKGEIYKSFLRKGASLRSKSIDDGLETICGMTTNTFEEMKALYFSTVKQQNALNTVSGGQSAVSQEVLTEIESRLNGMSEDENKDFKRGFLLMGAAIGTMVLAGSCVATIGATCVIAMGLGVSTIKLQYDFARRELSRKVEADRLVAHMEELKNLGLTDEESISNLKKGWGWFIFEAVSIVPLASIVARSVKLGAGITMAGSVALMKNAGGRVGALRNTAKTVVRETEVNTATLVLGFEGYARQTLDFGKNALDTIASARGATARVTRENIARVERLDRLHRKGLISTSSYSRAVDRIVASSRASGRQLVDRPHTYVSGTAVNYTVKQIDAQTAKVVSDYLGNSPKAMRYLLSTYVKRLPKASARMAKVADAGELSWIKNPFRRSLQGFRNVRSKHLEEYSSTINRLYGEIDTIAKNGGDLDEYILKNVDDLTDIFMNIPVRKREIPYMFFFQGGFHVGKSGATLSTRLMHYMSNGLVMRKFFNARSILVTEGLKRQARTDLGMNGALAAYSSFEVFENFAHTISRSIKAGDSEATSRAVQEYETFQNQIVEKIAQASPGQDVVEIRRVLFAAKNLQDRATAQVLWDRVPTEQLLGLEAVQGQAHRIIRETYKTANEFEKFVSALKVIVLERNAGTIEII